MISAFLGQALAGGLISILTLTSAAFMLICAVDQKKAKWGLAGELRPADQHDRRDGHEHRLHRPDRMRRKQHE